MEAEEMLALYLEAEDIDIVTDIEDYASCTEECEDCPAAPACKQLSGGNYKLFKLNFDKQIRTIL